MIGLKYIHGQNILHRDIKPENLVFDNNGYLRITDFGIAKHYVINNKKDTSGTVGYLAPEVLCNVNHNFCIDYYAVGIITYELMYGHRPYLGKSKHEVKQLILTKQAEIDYDDLPEGFSNETADFINRLIQRKPKNRLGRNSINEVLTHPWFDGFDWENTRKKKLKAPYIPKIGDNFDKKYCLQSNKIGTETMDRYKNIMMEDDYELIFKDFNCNKIPEELIGYSKKQINNYLKEVNNHLPNNISISFSRNNRNENKQNHYLVHPELNKDYANIINKNLIQKKNKIYKNDNEYTDFDSSIFKQIASLNKSLNNIALNNQIKILI
jgi:serine/threonine protein kinase